MAGQIKTIVDAGFDGLIVNVECRLVNSLPGIVIVGMGNRSVAESKERIRGALASCKIKLPTKKIVINLSPADTPKYGSSLDLAILISILVSTGTVKSPNPNVAIFGEVGLDGHIKPIRGIIGKIMWGASQDVTEFWIPDKNLAQASLVPDIKLRAFKSVSQVYDALKLGSRLPPPLVGRGTALPEHTRYKEDFDVTLDDVSGQYQAKRALQIAAAGWHNILFSGTPGTGKSLLARSLPCLLPQPNNQEILEITHLQSLASHNFEQIVKSRPFKAPHHTSTIVSILGSSADKPGQISLAHRGVMLLDEIPEFNRQVLEGLREPLENGEINLSKAGKTVKFPANFLLVATANPCPCGFYGSKKHRCRCSFNQIEKYQKKLSGPLIDRIDMFVDITQSEIKNLLPSKKSLVAEAGAKQAHYLSSKEVQGSVAKVWQQRESGENNKRPLSADAKHFLDAAAEKLTLSSRAYLKTAKVSGTIAALEGVEVTEMRHVAEALQYRQSIIFLTPVV